MNMVFYIHASVALFAMILAMLTSHAVHALLYAIFSLLCVAVSMYSIGAPMASALEVIAYTGAIMVLFVFAIMLLRVSARSSPWIFKKSDLIVAILVVTIFLSELSFVLKDGFTRSNETVTSVVEVARNLFGLYGFMVEVVSFILLAGLATAIFVARSAALHRDIEVRGHDSP